MFQVKRVDPRAQRCADPACGDKFHGGEDAVELALYNTQGTIVYHWLHASCAESLGWDLHKARTVL